MVVEEGRAEEDEGRLGPIFEVQRMGGRSVTARIEDSSVSQWSGQAGVAVTA